MKRLFMFALALAAMFACAAAFAEPPAVSNDVVLSDDVVQGEAIVMIKIDWDGKTEITTEAAYRAADAVAAAVGAHVKDIDMSGTRLMGSVWATISNYDMTATELVRRLRMVPAVLSAEPNRLIRINETRPNDKEYSKLWGMEAIGAPAAWDRITGSNSIYAAVIDSGLQPHDDLDENIDWSLARDFTKTSPIVGKDGMRDYNSHGTHVMGTIAGVGNNGTGVTGVNWNIRGIPLKVGSDSGNDLDVSAIIKSINFVTEQVKSGTRIAAVNMSYGSYEEKSLNDYLNIYDGAAMRLLNQASNAPLVAASAGNEGLEHGVPFDKEQKFNGYQDPRDVAPKDSMHYPSSLSKILDNVVSVAAIGPDSGSGFTAAGFSNWSNTNVDISAPGVSIYSTGIRPDDYYTRKNGTSMASPHVTGAAALLAAHMDQLEMTWDGRLLKDILLSTADSSVNPENTWAKSDGKASGNSCSVGDYRLSKHGLLRIDRAINYVDSISTVKTVTLSLGASAIDTGADTTVTAAVTPTKLIDGRKTITWSASPSDAVTITPTGGTTATITGLKAGEVTITASPDYGSEKKTIKLTVNQDTHVHTWSWKNDETNHWEECTCGQKQNIAPHSAATWNKTAAEHSKTCEETNCQRVFARGTHAAAAGAPWQKDGSKHWKTCKDCDAEIDSGTHVAGAAVRSDGTHHWRECTQCREEMDRATHTWGTALAGDTTHHWQTCTLAGCGARGNSAPHTKSDWHKNSSHHWHVCTTAGCPSATAQLDMRTHDWVGSKCGTCAYDPGSDCAHEYEEQYDAVHHWLFCRKCSTETLRTMHTMVWRNFGDTHEYGCQGCSWIDRSGPHIYGPLVYNALDHWRECMDCGAAEHAEPHTYDEGGWCTAGCGYRDPSWEARPVLRLTYPNGQRWTEGRALTFAVPRAPEELLDVLVDLRSVMERCIVAPAEVHDATRGAGSMVLTLDPVFLSTLSPGEHGIKMMFLDGYADGTFVIEGSTSGGTGTGGGQSSGGGGGGCAAGAAGAVFALACALYLKRRGK